MAEAAKAMADETAGRAARFMRRHDAMRGVLLAALDALGTRKIEGPDVTVSLRADIPATVITDEARSPTPTGAPSARSTRRRCGRI